jgi:CubicO group peptidase (beta-lactamase class C family)
VLTNRAAGYSRQNGALVNCVHFEMDIPHAAGALYSTVEDLLLWDQALYTEKLLPAARLEAMFTAGKGDYGCGWFIREHANRRCVEHDGGIAGFVTSIARYPEDKVVIIVLCNFGLTRVESITDWKAGLTTSPQAIDDILEHAREEVAAVDGLRCHAGLNQHDHGFGRELGR